MQSTIVLYFSLSSRIEFKTQNIPPPTQTSLGRTGTRGTPQRQVRQAVLATPLLSHLMEPLLRLTFTLKITRCSKLKAILAFSQIRRLVLPQGTAVGTRALIKGNEMVTCHCINTFPTTSIDAVAPLLCQFVFTQILFTADSLVDQQNLQGCCRPAWKRCHYRTMSLPLSITVTRQQEAFNWQDARRRKLDSGRVDAEAVIDELMEVKNIMNYDTSQTQSFKI